MNRAQQFKSGDVSLGGAHEWACAFGRQGGTAQMLQLSQENPVIMRHAVSVMNPKTSLERMVVALLCGIEVDDDGVYTFFDPGLSIACLFKMPLTARLFHPHQNHEDMFTPERGPAWIGKEDRPQMRRLRLVVHGSFHSKNLRQQKALLNEGERTPGGRVQLMLLVLRALLMEEGNELFYEDECGYDGDQRDSGVRVTEKCGDDCHYVVGDIYSDGQSGFYVSTVSDSVTYDYIGMSALLETA